MPAVHEKLQKSDVGGQGFGGGGDGDVRNVITG